MVSAADKQKQILPLFEKLTFLNRDPIPIEERDPELAGVGALPRGTLFSCFHERHLLEATKLFEVLYKAATFERFLELAQNARKFVNEGLFAYAVSVAIIHRDDLKGITLPPIQEVFPDRFVPCETINLARKVAKQHKDEDVQVKIEQTGNILDPEYKLAYFREDVGVNSHHWFWHVVYPANWDAALTGKVKDRKGELFYYMHQQMSARYDCERLSNGLNRMIPFHNFEEDLEGYAPHLTSLVSGLQYASRPQGMSLQDLPDVDVQEMERWRERIMRAIDLKHVHDKDNNDVPLTEENGANILGSMIESSSDSVNRNFYGSLHNWGHVMMARITDPDGSFEENPGVMSDTSTSLRDPIFYRWHRFVDNIFQNFKATLHLYTKDDFSFPGVEISHVTVKARQENVVRTFLKEEVLDLSHGIDFATTHKVKVLYEHLDHDPFSYEIEVNNTSGAAKHATVRIFLGPKYDELGNLLKPDERRKLFIELDKFHRELAPGKNTINRNSNESSVTLSHTYSFDDLYAGKSNPEGSTEYCNCGWPEHMLIPKGTSKGMVYELFVMLTDYTIDNPGGSAEKTVCADALSYCGAKDQIYPDKRAMGFPFDRPCPVEEVKDILTPNISITEVIVLHVA